MNTHISTRLFPACQPVQIIRLSRASQQRFAQALIAPPEPTQALRRAMARHDKLVRAR